MASLSSCKTRPLLIPHKRALSPLPSSAKVSKALNPSAIPAEIRFKRSHEEAAQKRNLSAGSGGHNESPSEDEGESESPCFNASFSMPPQPFLDPSTWEAMLKRDRERLALQPVADASGSQVAQDEESQEQRRQRMERETEYGSMAIRGRSSVRGRGKRGQGRGNVYWGGRH